GCRSLDRSNARHMGALQPQRGGASPEVRPDRWESELSDAYPVRVVRTRVANSPGLEPDLARAADGGPELRPRPLCIHLAEGTSAAAADEVRALAERGLLDERLLAGHVVGADDDGVRRQSAAG